jgi:transaldolase
MQIQRSWITKGAPGMAIFLDTGKPEEIKRYLRMGIIRGVTTNPSILKKEGMKGDWNAFKEMGRSLAALVSPFPLSLEVMVNDKQGMLTQALEMAGWAENIVVKIPIHGPEGELENLEVIHELETRHKVKINVTAMMSAQQGLVAAMAGATYVSLFGGRINNMGYDSVVEVRTLRKLIDDFHLESKIILGSTREVLNVVEWLEAGAHIVTVLPHLLEGMIVHPYTKETVRMFLSDARKIFGEKP